MQVVQGVLSLVQARLENPKQRRLSPQVGLGHLVLSRERAVGHLRAVSVEVPTRNVNDTSKRRDTPRKGATTTLTHTHATIVGVCKQARLFTGLHVKRCQVSLPWAFSALNYALNPNTRRPQGAAARLSSRRVYQTCIRSSRSPASRRTFVAVSLLWSCPISRSSSLRLSRSETAFRSSASSSSASLRWEATARGRVFGTLNTNYEARARVRYLKKGDIYQDAARCAARREHAATKRGA